MLFRSPGSIASLALCGCRKHALQPRRIQAVLNGDAGVPAEYRGRTFESWDAMPYEWRKEKLEARHIASVFASGDIEMEDGSVKRGLVLAGPAGRGKSSLATAIAMARAEHQQVLWIDFRQFL